MLRFLLLALLFPAFLLAANNESVKISQSPVQIAVSELPLYLSPYAKSPLQSQYAHLFFDPLVRWGSDKKIQNRLVKQWKIIKPGVIRFSLKKNIKFHSGAVLTTNDVIWTFTQIAKNPQFRQFFSGIKQIKRFDRYRFDLYSALPEAQLLDYLTHFFVLDSEFYQRNNVDTKSVQAPISGLFSPLSISGTGPYTVKNYNSSLQLTVISNKAYWQHQPALAELNFIKIKSANSRSFALLASDVHICESVANKMIDTVDYADTKSVIERPISNALFFTINDTRNVIFKQKKVREAIDLAINKMLLKQSLRAKGRINSILTPLKQALGVGDDFQSSVYDLSKAKTLLSHVNMPVTLTLLVFSEPSANTLQVADALGAMMAKLGVKLLVSEVNDKDAWNKRFFEYDFTLSDWDSPLLVSHNIYYDLFSNSLLAQYLKVLAVKEKGDLINPQAVFFEALKQYRIITLYTYNQLWSADNQYNLSAIFSADGIPYWHLLTKSND